VGRRALDGVSLVVQRGEVFGYLGPNGSGKTTTLKILLGLVAADSGRITILDRSHADRSWRYQVGYLPEQPYFYDYLTAAEYLDYAGRLSGMSAGHRRERARLLLERVAMARSADVPLRRYSKGMLQRVGLAQALINDPELVVLDEPMSGLDPLGRRLVRDVILDLKSAGKTVFFSTHILSDAESLCDRVALLKGGRLVKAGRLDEILPIDVSHVEVLVAGLTSEAQSRLVTPLRSMQILGERCRLEVEEPRLGTLLGELNAAKTRILGVQAVRQSLEDYFVQEMSQSDEGAPCSLDD
jgi:ABC-2 type transport system ATP-binding protein